MVTKITFLSKLGGNEVTLIVNVKLSLKTKMNNNITEIKIVIENDNIRKVINSKNILNNVNDKIKKQFINHLSVNDQKPWIVLQNLKEKESGSLSVLDPINEKITLRMETSL